MESGSGRRVDSSPAQEMEFNKLILNAIVF